MGAKKKKVLVEMATAAVMEAKSELPMDAARMGEPGSTGKEASARVEARAVEILEGWFKACEDRVRGLRGEVSGPVLKRAASERVWGEASLGREECEREWAESSWRFVATRDIRTEWGTVVREGGGFTVSAKPSPTGARNVVMQGEELNGQPVAGASSVFTFRLDEAGYWEGLGFRRERVWGEGVVRES